MNTNKVILKPLFQKKADPLTLLLKDIFKDNRNAMSYLGALSIGLGFSQTDSAFAESKLEKIKNKIKAGEDKLIGKVWGTKDCSQYSTKTLAGLADYKRCKSGLEPSEKEGIFKSLSWKGKKR